MANLPPDFWYGLGSNFGYAVAAAAGSISGAFTYWIGRHQKKSRHPSVAEVTAQSQRLVEFMTELRVKTGAGRAYVVKLGNGEEFIDGKSILKKRRICEVSALNVPPQSEKFENMPISRVPEEMKLVEQEGPSYTLVRDLPHGEFKWLCEMGGSVAVVRAAIRRKGEVIGFVGLDFMNDSPPDNLGDVVRYAGLLEWMI